jgi:hypothetical protein
LNGRERPLAIPTGDAQTDDSPNSPTTSTTNMTSPARTPRPSIIPPRLRSGSTPIASKRPSVLSAQALQEIDEIFEEETRQTATPNRWSAGRQSSGPTMARSSSVLATPGGRPAGMSRSQSQPVLKMDSTNQAATTPTRKTARFSSAFT